MSTLRLRYVPDDEWLGQLYVSAASDKFSAQSVAWFDLANLRQFATGLAAYPLSPEAPPSIKGGLGQNELTPAQTLVSIIFEPHDLRGAVRATIHLETEVWNGKERDLAQQSTIRFLLTYSDLATFSSAVLDLLDGRTEDAVLQTSE